MKSLDDTNSRIKFYNQDLSDWEKVENIFKENNIKEIIHFAAFSQVAESMNDPIKYYIINTNSTSFRTSKVFNYLLTDNNVHQFFLKAGFEDLDK